MMLSEKEREIYEQGYWLGFSAAKARDKGKGWEEVKPRPIRVDYGFKCKDCGAQIDGFVVSPRFCPYCGKEHG